MDIQSLKLIQVLDEARADIEVGLREAEAELAELEARRSALLDLIARANAALGSGTKASGDLGRTLTLHQAMSQVLREHGNRAMSARELADQINQRRLYAKRDGSLVEVSQIHARAKNYSALFDKVGSKLQLHDY